MVPALLSVFLLLRVVMLLALWPPSSIAAHFAFCFTSCVVVLAFWSPSTPAHFALFFLVVIKSGLGTQGEVYSADRSKAVVPVLVLLFGALWFILRGDLLYVLPCAILFFCFSVLLAL